MWQPALHDGFRFSPYHPTFAEFTPDLLAQCDLAVPLSNAAAEQLYDLREYCPFNPIPITHPDVFQLCDDKLRLIQRLAELGFDVSAPILEEPVVPCIIKKRRDQLGANSHLVRTLDQADEAREKLVSGDYYCQEVVESQDEYATHLLIREGRAVCDLTIAYRHRDSVFVQGRDRPLYKGVVPTRHLELFTAVLNAIGFEGLCCIDYKEVRGEPRLLEINPRFGGSLVLFFFGFLNRL